MSATRRTTAMRGAQRGRAAEARAGRPIIQVLEWLGRRWTLRVLWELRAGALPFRALQERCDALSPTVLNDRLRELRATGIVELQAGGGYVLTADGRTLGTLLLPLHTWAERWARRPRLRRGL